MDSNTLIHLKHLSCSYTLKEHDKVLYIDELIIEKGKLIFLLGASGSGKSTLLETIGLMNNTIATGNVLWNNGKSVYDFAELWATGNNEKINELRKSQLSFIFQNTNLMDNFTAYENICLSQMIKNNEKQDKVVPGARNLMNQVGLPSSVVNNDTLAVNLSGGQRQRVSFVRALNNQFQVLLCDEPTGNLDEVNANELLQIIKQNLGENRTAIVVSHDVNLALKYADKIILLTKSDNGHGEILKEFTYDRNYWQNFNNDELVKFKSKLIEKFENKKITSPSQESRESTIPPVSYRQLFVKKESVVLFGPYKTNWVFLILILTLTFIAIGFSNGALEYLNKKRNDAFMNWLSVMIPSSKGDQASVDEFATQLNDPLIKKTYNVRNVTTYKEYQLPIFKFDLKSNQPTNDVKYIKGRLLMDDIDGQPDPLKSDLFSSKNIVVGDSSFRNQDDIGIVVTQQLLNYLNYPENAAVVYFDNGEKDMSTGKENFFKVPVPIRTVIKELPNKNKFITTESFYKSYIAPSNNRFDFTQDNKKKILFFVEDSKNLTQQAQSEVENLLKKESIKKLLIEHSVVMDESEDSELLASERMEQINTEVFYDTCEYFYKPGYLLTVQLDPMPGNYKITENLAREIGNIEFFEKNREKIIRIIDYDLSNSQGEIYRYDYLSINFTNLEKVEEFSDYISKELNTGEEGEQANVIELDTAKIKDKKNFLYIMNITSIITILLIVFSIIAISMFISNLLKNHLNKIKMNIGTYKAFGLSDKETRKIYLTIMMRFIFSGMIISVLIAYIAGYFINNLFKDRIKLEEMTNYFVLADISTFILIVVIFIVSLLVSYLNITKILSKTPGDLIYNR